ncbi:MAG: DUF1579 domain-containing protein [bacterium]|nr:DUF1579 domain-containing protein [bacterium]
MTRRIAPYVLAAFLGAGLLAATQALSQEGKEPPAPNPEEMMKAYEAISAPGPQHAQFQDAVGTWKTETKSWMGPGEPEVSTGTSELKTILGGRYLQERFACTTMNRPFEGMGLFGYDNVKKKYVSAWVDNFGTGIMLFEGTRDEATKTTTMFADYVDPFMGPTKLKSVIREVSKDKHVFEMYMIGSGGDEQKSMEITYTR